jgi:hypothetical protein
MANVRWKDKTDVGIPAAGDRLPITDVSATDTDRYVRASALAGTRDIVFIIDGGGSAITTGVKGYLPVDFAGTITTCEEVDEQSWPA